MIKGVVGLMGSGKSHYVVEHDIIAFLRQPVGNLYHTIDGVRLDRICIDYGLNYFEVVKRVEYLGDDEAQKMDCDRVRGIAGRIISGDVPPGSLIIFDEIHKVWPHKPKTALEDMSREWDGVLAEQRKWKLNFIVMTQNIERLSIAWRCRVDLLLKLKRLAFFGKLTAESYTVTFMTSTGPGRFERYRQDNHVYNKKIFDYYDSYKKGVQGGKFAHDASLYSGGGIVKFWHLAVAGGLVGLALWLTMTGDGYISKAVLGKKNGMEGVSNVANPVGAPSGNGVANAGGAGKGSAGGSSALVPVLPISSSVSLVPVDKPVLVGCMQFEGKSVAVYEDSAGVSITAPMECSGLVLGSKSPVDANQLRALVKGVPSPFGSVVAFNDAPMKWNRGGVVAGEQKQMRWGDANRFGGRNYDLVRGGGAFEYESLAPVPAEKTASTYPVAPKDEGVAKAVTITGSYDSRPYPGDAPWPAAVKGRK